MKTSWLVALTCALATLSATAQNTSGGTAAVAEKGKMVIAADGARLGTVYRVGPDGSAQIIIDGKLVSIPASTLSTVDGKLTTNLRKSQVIALH